MAGALPQPFADQFDVAAQIDEYHPRRIDGKDVAIGTFER
jgi:hypothetical protein